MFCFLAACSIILKNSNTQKRKLDSDNEIMSHDSPLIHAVKGFLARLRKGSFHTPAHHGGDGLSPSIREVLGTALFEHDLTELQGLDNLAHPSGPLLELEKEAARIFKADQTFFSVNGATLANQAAILSFCRPGKKVILQRDLHRSIYNGISLAGAEPVYLPSRIDQESGLSCGVGPEAVEKALQQHPDAKGLILSNPNYFGFVSDLPQIAARVHRCGKILMVDEALGSLFPFSSELPPSAMEVGADLVIHSGHKGLSGLTQTGLLHLKGERVQPERVQQAINLLQSTSPSYPLLLSLEAAIYQMELEGAGRVQKIKALSEKFDGLMGQLRRIRRIQTSDFTKLLLDTSRLGISGYEAESILSERFGIFPETAGPNYLLYFLSFGNQDEEIDHLEKALKSLENESPFKGEKPVDLPLPPLPEKVLNPREPFFSPKKWIPLSEAEGRIAGSMVIPYPPGVPILVPGERISAELVTYIETLIKTGAEVIGVTEKHQIEALE